MLIDFIIYALIACVILFFVLRITIFCVRVIKNKLHQGKFIRDCERQSKEARKSLEKDLIEEGIDLKEYYKLNLSQRLNLLRNLDKKELEENGIDSDQFYELPFEKQCEIYEKIRTKAQNI